MPAAEPEHPQDEQQDHRANKGDHHRSDDRVPADGKVDLENLGQDAADERAQDAGDEVAQQTQAMTERDPAGERSGDETHQDPDEDRVDVETDVNHFTDSLLKQTDAWPSGVSGNSSPRRGPDRRRQGGGGARRSASFDA